MLSAGSCAALVDADLRLLVQRSGSFASSAARASLRSKRAPTKIRRWYLSLLVVTIQGALSGGQVLWLRWPVASACWLSSPPSAGQLARRFSFEGVIPARVIEEPSFSTNHRAGARAFLNDTPLNLEQGGNCRWRATT